MYMKKFFYLLVMVVCFFSCEDNKKTSDQMNDVREEIKDAGKDIKDAGENMYDDAKEAGKNTKEDIEKGVNKEKNKNN